MMESTKGNDMFKIFLALLSVLFFSSCGSKIPYPSEPHTTDTIYIYMNKEYETLTDKYVAIESNLSMLLRSSRKKVHLIDTPDKAGKDGVLVTIDSLSARGGVERHMSIYYTVTDNATKTKLRENKLEASSVLHGYGKLASVITRRLSRAVVRITK